MIWDWTAKKNLQDVDDDKVADEHLDEGKSPSFPPEYGDRKNPRVKGKKANITSVKRKRKVAEEDVEDDADEDLWMPSVVSMKSDDEEKHGGKKFNKTTKSGFSVSGQKFSSAKVVDVDDDAGIWEWQFSLFNLPGMDLVEVGYVPLDASERLELRRNFRRVRRDFLRYIAYYNQSELEDAGVEDKGIRTLKKGKSPENYDVHLKIPYEYGGKNEFSNLLFIQTHPFGEDVHKFVDMQITSQPFGCRLSKLYIPVAPGRVYIPKDSTTMGGGKGMGDKTSVQGYSAEALKQLSLKSSMDRGPGK